MSEMVLHQKHKVEEAIALKHYLKSNLNIESEIIGSLAEKFESNHDIDILISNPKDTIELRDKLIELLQPTRIVKTDWNGIFLYGTKFGNVDIFFERPPRSHF